MFGRMIFLVVIVIVAFGAMAMMAMMTETEVDKVARPHDIHVSTFSLVGTPSGKVALYIDGHFRAPLETYIKTSLPLTVAERCGLSVWLQNEKGVWEHKCSLSCLDKGEQVIVDVVGEEVIIR